MSFSSNRFTTLLLLAFFSLFFLPRFASAETFYRNLKRGDSGQDVFALQKFLNQNSETRVAESGAGSLGNETEFFGEATKRAVVRLQEKYRSEVLFPAGLFYGTGFVGTLTRQKLNNLYAGSMNVTKGVSKAEENAPKPPPPPPLPDVSKPPVAMNNPNLENLDYFLSAVRSVGEKQGYTKEKLALIENQIRVEVATTTNLREKFMDDMKKTGQSAYLENSFPLLSGSPKNFFTDTFKKLKDVLSAILPEIPVANAAIGVPFGGQVIFPIYCTCSGNWMVGMRPFGPTYVVLLTHYLGAQAFLYHNAPFPISSYMLGTYIPGAGHCLFYIVFGCIDVPAEGATTPMLGSSLVL